MNTAVNVVFTQQAGREGSVIIPGYVGLRIQKAEPVTGKDKMRKASKIEPSEGLAIDHQV
nr:hypothetical protein [uncultured Acetobacterium sp.]